MKAKNMRKFSGLIIIVFLFALWNVSAQQNPKDQTAKSQDNKSKTKKNEKEAIDDDKLSIINLLISETRKDGLCIKKQKLYFSKNGFSEYISENFLKKIDDCATVLIGDYEYGPSGFDYNLYRFTSWEIFENEAFVIFMTKFAGGNTGGCEYTLKKKESWKIESTKCFASAS